MLFISSMLRKLQNTPNSSVVSRVSSMISPPSRGGGGFVENHNQQMLKPRRGGIFSKSLIIRCECAEDAASNEPRVVPSDFLNQRASLREGFGTHASSVFAFGPSADARDAMGKRYASKREQSHQTMKLQRPRASLLHGHESTKRSGCHTAPETAQTQSNRFIGTMNLFLMVGVSYGA